MTHVREQIIAAVASGIEGAGIFADVFIDAPTTIKVAEYPTCIIRRVSEEKREHIRLAVERVLTLEAEVVSQDYDATALASGMGDGVAAVENVLMDNPTWGGLAVGTELLDSTPDFNEPLSPRAVDRIKFAVMYRTKLDDAETVKVV